MKIIYSFWSKSVMTNESRLKQLKWLYALSVSSVKRYSNCEVILHTDSFGENLLGNLPFDKIKISLDDFSVDKHFWASSKIVALAHESGDVVHVDGDVVFQNREVLDKIISTNYDIIAQSLESGDTWDRAYKPYIHEVKDNCSFDFDYDVKEAYNCGVIGFKNSAIKKAFVDSFNAMTSELRYAKNKTELMVLVEQWNLRQVAEKYKATEFLLLGNSPDWGVVSSQAEKIGYVHLLGGIKWKNEIQEVVKEKALDNLLALLKSV